MEELFSCRILDLQIPEKYPLHSNLNLPAPVPGKLSNWFPFELHGTHPPFPSRHLHTPSFMWFLDHSQMTSLRQYCYSPCLDLDVKLADMFGQMFYSLQTYHGTDKCKVCYFLPRLCSLLVIMIGRSLNHCSSHRQNVRIILTRLSHCSLSSVLFFIAFFYFYHKRGTQCLTYPKGELW